MARSSLLQQPDILKYIDTLHFKTQYIRITVLDSMDCPLRTIEGRATGGSININGSSAVRRTGSLNLVTELADKNTPPLDIMYEVTNIKTLISMNKRIRIEMGIENSGKEYLTQKVFWILLGTFVISNASVTHNASNGIAISLKLTDKMAFLNGEAGGTFATEIIHSPAGYIQDGSQSIGYHGTETVMVTEGVKVKTLINYLLADFAEFNGFEYSIENIPDTLRNLIRWMNSYYLTIDTDGTLSLTEEKSDNMGFAKGEVMGYTETDFVYPLDKDLSSKAGETIASVLDTIKNTLGNYEYFFDIDGVFRFREIPNFLNEGGAVNDLTEAIAEKYFFNTDTGQSTYSFKDSALVTSYANNPQYTQIKNDFVVWGKKPETERPIQYHLILKDAPNKPEYLYWKVTVDEKTGEINKAESLESPAYDDFLAQDDDGYYINFTASSRPGRTNKEHLKDDDWRLRLYLIAKSLPPVHQTPFDKEIIDKLPLLYELKMNGEQEFFTPIYERNNLSYWLDIINTDDIRLMNVVNVRDFNIETIGRRVKVLPDDNVNCMFYTYAPEIENMDFIEVKCNDEDCDGSCPICGGCEYKFENNHHYWYIGSNYTLTGPNGKEYNFWRDCVSLGTIENPAYDLLRSSLHEYLSYNNNINIQTMPVYHLDANQRITVDNTESDIHGDYVINSITLPLDLGGMMTVNARKAVERI